MSAASPSLLIRGMQTRMMGVFLGQRGQSLPCSIQGSPQILSQRSLSLLAVERSPHGHLTATLAVPQRTVRLGFRDSVKGEQEGLC